MVCDMAEGVAATERAKRVRVICFTWSPYTRIEVAVRTRNPVLKRHGTVKKEP